MESRKIFAVDHTEDPSLEVAVVVSNLAVEAEAVPSLEAVDNPDTEEADFETAAEAADMAVVAGIDMVAVVAGKAVVVAVKARTSLCRNYHKTSHPP